MRHVHEPEADTAASLSDPASYRLREMIVTLELDDAEAAMLRRIGGFEQAIRIVL